MIAGVEVDFHRVKGAKRLHIRIRRDGTVYVSAPYGVPMSEVEDFVSSYREWIEGNLKKVDDTVLRDGATVTILGEPCILHLIESRSSAVRRDGNDIFLMCKGDPESVMREYHRSIVMEVAPLYLEKWSSITGLRCSELRTKCMRTKWGTCNPKDRRIWLNTRLAEKSPECIEYVVLHELCHVRYADHGAGFKAMLDRYMPDWRERRKRLNGKLSPS